jgi:ABC-type uncharacterized transport system involved in gliding motility auxiliary subunit
VKRILGLLGWLGVVLVLAAVAIRFVKPEWMEWSRWLAVAAVVVTGIYALSQWREIARSFQARNVRYGTIAAASVLIFLAILVGINWIANRQNKRWDLTESQQFTLSDQTRQVVGELDQPLRIRVFYESRDGGSDQQYRDKLDEYAYLSNQVSVEYIDAIQEPSQAQAAEVQSLPTILFEYAGRTERTSSTDEQSLTNTLKKVILGQAKKVYFVQGHGEKDTSASDPSGYSGAVQQLKGDNFEAAPLNLAQQGKIPDDASVLIIAGPKSDLLPGEIDAVTAYLTRGGKLMLMLDPPTTADAPDPTGLIALAKSWAIDVGRNIVIDQTGMGQMFGGGPETPIAMPVSHAITRNLRQITAFALARSATPIEGGSEGRFAQKVVESAPQSWAETDFKRLFTQRQVEANFEAGDLNGPVAIASATSMAAPEAPPAASPDAPKPETRVIVIGDSDFAANRLLFFQGNPDLFLNMVNWLAQQEDLISIRPRDPQNRGIQMTADQVSRLFWITIAFIPLVLFGNAVWVWWKRR